MRTIKNTNLTPALTSLFLLFSLTFLNSCKKDPEQTARQRNQQLLISAPWNIKSVIAGGSDHTSDFTGMTLRFQAASFTVSNGGLIWPASDTWAFMDDKANSFSLSDGTEIEITSISSTELVLSLVWSETTLGSGRTKSIEGEYVFSFTSGSK